MPLKILLADDSMTAQNMGKKILTDAGYNVVAVSNGAAAIKKIASERPDIAILDEYMPGYTGSEVCERVKGAVETSRIPVLLTVGKMEPFDAAKANRVRADGVMIKPFEASDLIAAVQSIAQRLLAAGASRTQPQAGPVRQSVNLEDTVPIPSPAGVHDTTLSVPAPTHDATVRLTPDQLRAIQDSSFNEWVTSPEVKPPEMQVAAEFASAPAMASEISVEPANIAPVMEEPIFSAEDNALVATPAVVAEPEAPAEPEPGAFAPATTNEPVTPEIPTTEEIGSIFAVQPAEAIQANFESGEPAKESSTLEVAEAEEVPTSQPPVLETNAPLTPGPVTSEQAPEFEATAEAPIEVMAAPAEGLEVTSPPHEFGGDVQPETNLVTESDDMSEFVTKFGSEIGEAAHVGIASDLPPEQLAAINSVQPADQPAGLAETAPVSADVTEPILQAVQLPDPIVAYVPAIEDTQAIAPIVDEPPTETTLTAVPDVVETEVASLETVQAIPEEPASEEPVQHPEVAVASPETEVEPVELEQREQSEVAAPTMHESTTPAESVEIPVSMHAVEAAAAAAVGAAVAGVAQAIHQHASIDLEPAVVHEAEKIPADSGDERHFAEVESQSAMEPPSSEVESVAGESGNTVSFALPLKSEAESVPSSDSVQGISDNKLADAVARAVEHLKPQLITEIIRELSKQ